MSGPFVGEIRMFAGNFAPAGWAFCAGQLMPISENETLFNLIGTTYGGDGQTTFALPNLSGRVPLHFGSGPQGFATTFAETGGTETVTLTTQQIPQHAQSLQAAVTPADQTTAVGTGQNTILAQQAAGTLYTDGAPDTALHPSAVASAGGSQPHENLQPVVALNYIISLFGVFPSQT